MSPLPELLTGRWDNPARLSYDNAVCWHILLGSDAAVQAAAATARKRLAAVRDLHMTPPEWLHMTVLRVGTTDQVMQDDMSLMLASAQACLARAEPVTVTLQRVFYHPEAIALIASPGSALAPFLEAARAATREVLGTDPDRGEQDAWTPHLTLCYSAVEQLAAPVIAKLGQALPPCDVTIREMSLGVQDGAEGLWKWKVAGSAQAGVPRP